jgi:hypothetical protein
MVEIVLSEYDMALCRMFSQESALTQQRIEFGQRSTKERRLSEIARDNLIGKMGEVAVSKYLYRQWGIKAPVNFDIYPRGDCDDVDITVNGWGIDIKTTRFGCNLLFERRKLEFRRQDGSIPDALVICKVPWNEARDEPEGYGVRIIGCISIMNLINPNNRNVLTLAKGQCIPGTKTQLQADNYVVPFGRLCGIAESVEYMRKHGPIRRMAV